MQDASKATRSADVRAGLIRWGGGNYSLRGICEGRL